MIYLLIFIVSLSLSLLATPVCIKLGHRWHITDKPGGRRKHQGEVPRLGGVALFISFVGAGLLVFGLSSAGLWEPIGAEDRKLLTGVLVGSIVIFGFGILDDLRQLPPWPQFVAQFVVALIAIAFDIIIERVTLPIYDRLTIFPDWITYPLTIFWMMGMINTVNWLDGLDGLATGVAAIASLLFAIHAYSLGQATVALFPLALAAACLGFLPFNFHPARIFLGGGSMLLGYSLASLSILAPAKVATALLVLGVPIIDVAWLIVERWRRRGNPTHSGRDHLHYRLLDLGLSTRQIVLLYYTFCATFGILALLIADRFFKLIALAVLCSLMLILLRWLSRSDPT